MLLKRELTLARHVLLSLFDACGKSRDSVMHYLVSAVLKRAIDGSCELVCY